MRYLPLFLNFRFGFYRLWQMLLPIGVHKVHCKRDKPAQNQDEIEARHAAEQHRGDDERTLKQYAEELDKAALACARRTGNRQEADGKVKHGLQCDEIDHAISTEIERTIDEVRDDKLCSE